MNFSFQPLVLVNSKDHHHPLNARPSATSASSLLSVPLPYVKYAFQNPSILSVYLELSLVSYKIDSLYNSLAASMAQFHQAEGLFRFLNNVAEPVETPLIPLIAHLVNQLYQSLLVIKSQIQLEIVAAKNLQLMLQQNPPSDKQSWRAFLEAELIRRCDVLFHHEHNNDYSNQNIETVMVEEESLFVSKCLHISWSQLYAQYLENSNTCSSEEVLSTPDSFLPNHATSFDMAPSPRVGTYSDSRRQSSNSI